MKRIIPAVFLLALMAFAFAAKRTDRTITGTIVDQDQNPVSFAAVLAKGTKISTAAQNDGKFSITIPDNVTTLIVSAINYTSTEVILGKENNIKVIMHKMGSAMTDVVVTTALGVPEDLSDIYSMPMPGSGYFSTKAYKSPSPQNEVSVNFSAPQIVYDEDKKEEPAFNPYNSNFDTEGYDAIIENPFMKTSNNPLSTFSIDVDAASYSNIRRFLTSGSLPPAGAVRIEEMINYFSYKYPQPAAGEPFSVNTEMAPCPWNAKHKLVLIGLQGKSVPVENLPSSNLVFLVDVSGSMDEPNKLPLVQSSLKLLVDQLRPQDRVALVVYAGNAGTVLPSTSADNKIKIKEAIDQLEAGGSTAGGAGIQLAYKIAKENFIKEGNNRVILCTDGDFNVGMSSDAALENLIENERKSGVFLSVLGFGTGNYQDAKMQKLADKGNGNHQYIDNISEAKKVFVNEFGGTLFTIAKDVKLQIEFNPSKVQGYRLIGYENRMLAKEDFNDDKKDAGELGSGHTVTALYELIPAGIKDDMLHDVDALRYNTTVPEIKNNYAGNELMYVKLRYKQPDGDVSKLIEHPVLDENISIKNTSDNFRFASAVAAFGMLLRNSAYCADADFDMVLRLSEKALDTDAGGYRHEFIDLVKKASMIKEKEAAFTE